MAQFASEPRIDYATYLGATRVTPSLAVNSSGYAFVVGGSAGGCDVAKLNPTGTAVVCVNVPSAEPVVGVALDHSDAIYIVGNVSNGVRVVKLSPDGSQIQYSTFVQGATATAIAVDSGGNAYIAGTADATFTPSPGAYQTQLASGYSAGAFAVKLSAAGIVDYATYDGIGTPSAIAIDSHGQLWMVGSFPLTIDGGAMPIYGGPYFVHSNFINQLDPDGAKLLFSTGFGAGQAFYAGFSSYAYGVAIDAQDAAYVVGSAAFNVPVTSGVLNSNEPLTVNSGYLVKFSSSGSVEYGTYLGTGGQAATAVAVDAAGNAVVALNEAFASEKAPCFVGSSVTEIEVVNASASAVLAATYLLSDFNNLVFAPNSPLGAHDFTVQQTSLYAAGTTRTLSFFATPGAYQMLYTYGDELETTAAGIDLATPSGVQFNCALSSATLTAPPVPVAVAPGELISLFGEQFPEDTKLTFDGFPAPILYEDSNRIDTVVPFEVMGSTTNLWLNMGRNRIDQERIGPITMPLMPAVPAIFSNGIINQDGTLNSAGHPAAPGSIITVYMTGLGSMLPAIPDGSLGPLSAPFPVPILGVSASVGPYTPTPESMATVLFFGQAPGLIAGMIQVNVQIPSSAASGNSTLWVYVGNYFAEDSIAIQ